MGGKQPCRLWRHCRLGLRGVLYELRHPPDRFFESPEDGVAHNRVSDVELLDLRDRRDRLNVLVGEAVARMNGEADFFCMRGRTPQFFQRGIATTPRVRITTRMHFDCGDA